MATYLKQSTAIDIALGPFLDDVDGKTAKTGLTLVQADFRLKKNDANWGQKNQSSNATHEENGWYEVSLNSTDTNTLGTLVVACVKAGALPVWREFMVVPANVFDSLVAGTDLVDVSIEQVKGSAINALVSGRIDASIGAVAAGAIAAAAFAANALDAVWSTTTRLLTAGTNIVLAKGAGVTGFNDLDAAGVRSAVGLASANLDTQLGTINTNIVTVGSYVDTEVAAIKAKTDNLPSDPADASDIAAAFSALDAKVGTIDTNVDAILVDTGTDIPATLATMSGYIDTEVAAIKAKTDNLPSDPASGSTVAGLIGGVGAKVDIVDANVDTILVSTDTTIPGLIAALNNLSASDAADAVLDEVVEGSTTLREMLRGFASVLLSKSSGLETTTAVYRSLGDTKDRVTATVDADGNRSAITLDLT